MLATVQKSMFVCRGLYAPYHRIHSGSVHNERYLRKRIMKKSFLFLSAAALVLAACTQEIIQDENNAAFVDGPTSFTAVMEGD
ncbi:MAG: hypothetical protein IJQ93_08805 [Bacteroidales bacterium]|nr:hypothetical protein [Bacteroidales bacterium]